MSDAEPNAPSRPAPRHTKLNGAQDYVNALDTVIALAQRSVRVFDHSLEHDGFNSRKRYDLLRAFLLKSRKNKLQIAVHTPDYLAKFCPRMMMLLKQFSHSVEIYRTTSQVQHVTTPFIVVDEHHYARRYHFEDLRGLLALDDPLGAETLNLQFDELWAASRPAVSASTTGL